VATPFLSKGTQAHVIGTRKVFIKYTRTSEVGIDTRGRKINLKQALTPVRTKGLAIVVLACGKEESGLSISGRLVRRATTNKL